MKTSFYFLIFILALAILVACSPSESMVATAIAGTQQANPTAIPTTTDIPTLEPSRTPTNTPIPTDTPVPTITPTPDLRIVKISAQAALLSNRDLPEAGKFKLSDKRWTGRDTNQKIVKDKGEAGQNLIDSTGRIDGYWIVYFHEASNFNGPMSIFSMVELLGSVDGAQFYIDNYANCNNPASGATFETIDILIGDKSIACSYFDKDNAKHFELDFVYKNLFITISGSDWNERFDSTKEYVLFGARSLMDKISKFPLVEPTK